MDLAYAAEDVILTHLRYGDAVDVWRVAFEQDRRVSLRAEMRLPGEALLDFRVEQGEAGSKPILKQTALFEPRGLLVWSTGTPCCRSTT